MKKKLLIFLGIIFLCGVIFLASKKMLFSNVVETYVLTKEAPSKEYLVPIDKTVIPIFGGNKNIVVNFLGTVDPRLFSSENSSLLGPARESLLTDDLTVVGGLAPFVASNAKNIFYEGVDMFSLASFSFIRGNHGAIEKTLDDVSISGLSYIGVGKNEEEINKMKIYEKGDLSLGLLSFSDITDEDFEEIKSFQYVNRTRRADVFDFVSKAKKAVDTLVVIIHAKDSGERHTYRNEVLSREMIDSGADAVIVIGPDSIFDIEEYKGKPIFYSLGNFLVDETDESFRRGMGVKLVLGPSGARFSEYLSLHNPKPEVVEFSEIKNKNSESVESDYMRILGDRRYLYRKLSIYEKSNNATGMVSITIDDGYDVENVQKAISIFKETKTKATFFPIGEQIAMYPSVWRKAVDAGIEFGNHTDTHPWVTHESLIDFTKEIDDAKKAILSIDKNAEIRFFRPPYKDGFTADSWLPNTHTDVLKERDLAVALWSVDSYKDFYLLNEDPLPEETAKIIVDSTKDGDIILIHFDDRDIEALPLIIAGLRAKGLEPVTLSELLGF
jgi:peptidoglycan/xylan/chitin deacetylase (PgdA/CDA1 family)